MSAEDRQAGDCLFPETNFRAVLRILAMMCFNAPNVLALGIFVSAARDLCHRPCIPELISPSSRKELYPGEPEMSKTRGPT